MTKSKEEKQSNQELIDLYTQAERARKAIEERHKTVVKRIEALANELDKNGYQVMSIKVRDTLL